MALIGAGRIARVYADAVGELPPGHVSVVGVADANRAVALGVRFGCPVRLSGSAAQRSLTAIPLVTRCRPDGVVICTPHVGHAAQCVEFLRHRVAVLCEKPLSFDTRGALTAARAAESGARLIVSSKFRYAQDVVRALALLNSGAIGRPLSATGVFALRHWRSDIAIGGGGVLMDKGPQVLDLVRAPREAERLVDPVEWYDGPTRGLRRKSTVPTAGSHSE